MYLTIKAGFLSIEVTRLTRSIQIVQIVRACYSRTGVLSGAEEFNADKITSRLVGSRFTSPTMLQSQTPRVGVFTY
jgi:hypothetical protein